MNWGRDDSSDDRTTVEVIRETTVVRVPDDGAARGRTHGAITSLRDEVLADASIPEETRRRLAARLFRISLLLEVR